MRKIALRKAEVDQIEDDLDEYPTPVAPPSGRLIVKRDGHSITRKIPKRSRFFKMCEQLAQYRWCALLVEASYEDIKSPYDEEDTELYPPMQGKNSVFICLHFA